jgi:hypothetical protein
MSDIDRELLFNHALEADDTEYATELATPNGYIVSFNFDTFEMVRTPVVLSEEQLAQIHERDRRRRVSDDLYHSSLLPAFLDCVDKRNLDFYE